MLRITRNVFLSLAVCAAFLASASAASFKVLHSFSGPDGQSPTGLILAKDGFFYGAAAYGGDVVACAPDGCGLLFKSDIAGNVTTLHVFHATDGYTPRGLVQGTDGNFYGTTTSGGQPSGGGAGTIFRIDPTGNFTVLCAFVGGLGCCDGGGPTGPPIQASDGKFYGTTGAGGAFRDIYHQGGFGTVYQFDPMTNGVTILHSFNFDGNGFYPNGPLIQAKDGFLYGTTSEGSGVFRNGPGTAFQIDTAGNFKIVSVLVGQPLSGLIQASDGNFYGTSEGAGGSVFRLDASGNFSFVNLFDGADGWNPRLRLVQAADGFFYGTTSQGGLLDFQGGDVFRLSANGRLRILHSFVTTTPGGFLPNSELIQGADGALYGTAGFGGVNGHGTIFRLDQRVPGVVASVTVNPTVIHSAQSSTGTVTLSSPAPPGGTKVKVAGKSFQIVVPSTVTVPAGATKASFTIKALNVGAAQSVRIYAWFGGQGVRTTLNVLP